MSELNLRPQEAKALNIIESMLDVADMRNKGPIYADDPPRSGLCRIPEEDAAILRQYIAARRTHPTNSRFSDCHIWEPGDNLDTLSDKCEVLIKAADIKALMGKPANEPLTLEELREMDGETVYCVDINTDVKVQTPSVGTIKVRYNIPGESGTLNAKGLTLYRRPPERSENE